MGAANDGDGCEDRLKINKLTWIGNPWEQMERTMKKGFSKAIHSQERFTNLKCATMGSFSLPVAAVGSDYAKHRNHVLNYNSISINLHLCEMHVKLQRKTRL